MRVVKVDTTEFRVTVDLPLESIEFIGMELPQNDGFTRDWYEHVWKPLTDAAALPTEPKPGVRIAWGEDGPTFLVT